MVHAVAANPICRSPLLFDRICLTQFAQCTLRRLLCSLSILLTPAVLFAADADGAQPKAPACGIFYLLKADSVNSPSRNLAKEPCWTNPYVQGVLLRTHWNKIQPSEEAVNWSFFDQGVALAEQYDKRVGLLVTAGVTTPEWVYAAGASRFTLRKLRDPKSSPNQPLPWDPVFQAKWGNVIRALGERYDGNPRVAYVVMGGSGRKAESFFASAAEDVAAFDQLGGLTSWKTGVEWITDQYATHFSGTPFLLDLGAPVPSAQGRTALADVCSYAIAAYPHRFGVKSDGLSANYDLNAFGAREVSALSGSTTVGFQMSLPSKRALNPHGGFLLADALNRGIGLGAHFIEVYAVDCNDPVQAQVLTQTADTLKKTSSMPALPEKSGNKTGP